MTHWDPASPDQKIEIKIGAAEHKVESEIKSFKARRWWLYPLAIIVFIVGAILFYQTGEYNGTSSLTDRQAKGFAIFLLPAILVYVLRSSALENKAYYALSTNEAWGYDPYPNNDRARLLETCFKNHIFGSASFEDEMWGSFTYDKGTYPFYAVSQWSDKSHRSLFAVRLPEPARQNFSFYSKGELIHFEGIQEIPKELTTLLCKMRRKSKYFTVEFSGDRAIISIDDKIINGAHRLVEKDQNDHSVLKSARKQILKYVSFLVNSENTFHSKQQLLTINQAMKATFRMSFVTRCLFLLLIFYSIIVAIAVIFIVINGKI